MDFEIVGEITDIEVIATGSSIREIVRLRKAYDQGRWRKLKGRATVMTENRELIEAELHWYEASGIGRKEIKIKHPLSE